MAASINVIRPVPSAFRIVSGSVFDSSRPPPANPSVPGHSGAECFTLGDWAIDPLGNAVTSGKVIRHLEPMTMRVLLRLVDSAEAVVLRDDLLDDVWGARADTSDDSLTRCISQLRRAFGDSARNPRYIQTIPKRGYRLMQPAMRRRSGEPLASKAPRKRNQPASFTLASVILGFAMIVGYLYDRSSAASPGTAAGPGAPAALSCGRER